VLCPDVLPLEWALGWLLWMVRIHRDHYTDVEELLCC